MAFSKQDWRHVPAPVSLDTYGAAEMMADLGIHRRAALPLSGSTLILPPPAPDPTKHGPKLAKLAEEYPDIPNAWASLFDPKLVEQRDDGLGDGQMHRSGPNYQPNGSDDHHHGHRGSNRIGRHAEMGSTSGRNPRHERSPPNRALRHAKSLFELGKIPYIPFFNKGPLDSSRTVNGAATQRRRAALRASSQSGKHSLEGPPGDLLAPLRDDMEPATKKRSSSRGVQNIVRYHLSGNVRIPLRTNVPRVGSTPPQTPPLDVTRKTNAVQASVPPSASQKSPALSPHLSSRVVARNPEVSQWNTGKLVTNSSDYDYLTNPPKTAPSLSQLPVPAKVKVLSSGNSFQLPNQANPIAPKKSFETAKSGSAETVPPVAPASVFFPLVQKTPGNSSPVILPSAQKSPGTAKSILSPDVFSSNTVSMPKPQAKVEPGVPFIFKIPTNTTCSIPPLGLGMLSASVPDKPENGANAAVAPQKSFSGNPRPESPQTPHLGPLKLASVNIPKDSTSIVDKGGLEAHVYTNPPDLDNCSEDDTTLLSLHIDISAIRESVNKLKSEVSSIDDFEKSLQARISTMMQMKKDILQEIKTKEETMTKIEHDLQEIKRKHDTLKQTMPVPIGKTGNITPRTEPETGDSDIEMSDATEKVSQSLTKQNEYQVMGGLETKSRGFAYNEPIQARQIEVAGKVMPSDKTQAEEFLVKNFPKDEQHPESETEETKFSKTNRQLDSINFQTTPKVQLTVESEVETTSNESMESNETQNSPRNDRSLQRTQESQQWREERSQEQRSGTTQGSDTSGSFKTRHNKDLTARKLSPDRTAYEELEQQRLADHEKVERKREKAERERQTDLEACEKNTKDKIEIERLVKEHLERVKDLERRSPEAMDRRRPEKLPTDAGRSDEKENASHNTNGVADDAHKSVFSGNMEQPRQEPPQRVTEYEKVERRLLGKATDPKEATGLERSGFLGQAMSPKNSVADYAGSEGGQSRSKRPRFPYHISLDLRPNYDVCPLRVEVHFDENPEEAITQKCKEVMSHAAYQQLIGLPKLRLFLDQCNKRHAVRLAKYHASG